MFHCQLYGLRIVSDRPIPHLSPARFDQVDVRLTVSLSEPPPVSFTCKHGLTSAISGEDSKWGMLRSYPGGLEIAYAGSYRGVPASAYVRILDRGRDVHLYVPQPSRLPNAFNLLCHTVFPYVANLHGHLCLHANLVEVGNRIVGFVGASGTGKSSLSAGFWQRGCATYSDDLAALSVSSARTVAYQGITRPKAFRETARALGVSVSDLSPVYTDGYGAVDKRFVGTPARFPQGARPLAALYVLGPRRPVLDEPLIFPLSPPEALLRLIPNTSADQVLDRSGKARVYADLAQLVRRVPVLELVCPDGLGHIAKLCAVVSESLSARSGPEGRNPPAYSQMTRL